MGSAVVRGLGAAAVMLLAACGGQRLEPAAAPAPVVSSPPPPAQPDPVSAPVLRADGLTALLDGDRSVGWTDEGSPERNALTQEQVAR